MVPSDKRQGTSATSVKVSTLHFARVGLILIFVHAVFFEESWTELVVATSPYIQETITRTTNDEDSIFATENTVSGFSVIFWRLLTHRHISRPGIMPLLSYPW
jgi:hypothetical protein